MNRNNFNELIDIKDVTINLCPTLVISLIKSQTPLHIKSEIIETDWPTLSADTFGHQGKLKQLRLIGNNLTELSENIFNQLSNLEAVTPAYG